MKVGLVVFGLIFAVAAWSFVKPLVNIVSGAVSGDPTVRLDHGGDNRAYRVHVPPGAAPAQPRPLVLALHGGGQDPHALAGLIELNPIADREGFVVAYPAGRGKRWNDGLTANKSDDVGFLEAVVEKVAAATPIDRSRVFVTGVSDGAVMSYRFACESGGLVAAVAPVAGHLPVPVADNCKSAHPTAVLAVAGTADKIIPFEGVDGQMLSARASAAHWAQINRCGPTPKETERPRRGNDRTIESIAYQGCADGRDVVLLAIKGGGHYWPADAGLNAADEIWKFFAAHPMASPPG